MIHLTVLANLGYAHPVGDRHATQRSVLTVSPAQVWVDYTADVPHELVALAGGPERLASELRSGLLLTVDGTARPLATREPSPPPAPGDHVWSFAFHLAADAHPQHDIVLQTANLPEAANFFAGDVWVAPDLQIADASLWQDGEDQSLRWLRDPRHRTLSVQLGPEVPRLWQILHPRPGWVRAIDARPVRLGDEDGTTRLSPAGLGIRAGLAALLGASARSPATLAAAVILGSALILDTRATGTAIVVGIAFLVATRGPRISPGWLAPLLAGLFIAWRL